MRQQQQQAGIDVGKRPVGTERDHDPGSQRRHDRHQRPDDVKQRIGLRREDDLLEHELEAVGNRLQQAEGTGPVRAESDLDETDELPFPERQVRDAGSSAAPPAQTILNRFQITGQANPQIRRASLIQRIDPGHRAPLHVDSRRRSRGKPDRSATCGSRHPECRRPRPAGHRGRRVEFDQAAGRPGPPDAVAVRDAESGHRVGAHPCHRRRGASRVSCRLDARRTSMSAKSRERRRAAARAPARS